VIRSEERLSVELEERADDIVVVRMMNGKANALDVEFCTALVHEIEALATGNARAVVLTGSGNIFSAGVDLIRLCDDGPAYRDEFVPRISKLVNALFRFPKPLVAAVNGHAIAGGCIMACTADHRIMARSNGRIGVPELLVGVPLPTTALEVVRFVVPPHHMQAVVYGGATYSADEALAIGLVDEIVEPAVLLDHAVTVAGHLAAYSAEAFALTKRQLRAPALANIAAGADLDAEVLPVWQDAATLTRIRDYIARTFKRRDR
jgi:enoyl-CoA hydratase